MHRPLKIGTMPFLLLEDIGEPPYKIDRMLQQLRRQGVLSRVKGVGSRYVYKL